MPDKQVFILTNQYPYGLYETPFIANEIETIAKNFNRIFLIPLDSSNKKIKNPLPGNVSVIDLFEGYTYIRPKITFKFTLALLSCLGGDFLVNFTNPAFYRNLKKNVSLFTRTFAKSNHFKSFLTKNDHKNSLLYSFWFGEWVTISALIKDDLKLTIVSRAHGYDLYEERSKEKFIPFRTFQLKKTNRVVAISQHGLNYLVNRYQGFKTRFSLHFIGTTDKSLGPEDTSNDFLTIVSCSRLIPLKRIHRIAESLRYVNRRIKWVHFGGGPELERVKEISGSLPENILYELKGDVSNNEILDFYRNNYVDLFINVSETEGLPVSLMEAASFGIPMIATNVGGNAEIVTSKTGALLPPDFTNGQLTELINNFTQIEQFKKSNRNRIREFWKNKFDATVNAEKFIKECLFQ